MICSLISQLIQTDKGFVVDERTHTYTHKTHKHTCTHKVILSTGRKPLCLSAGKKPQLHPPFLSAGYLKNMQTCYFGHFRHAWLCTSKMIVSTSRRLRCLSAYQKYTYSFNSLLRYFILKNPAIWLADSIWAHTSKTKISPDIGLAVKYQ